MNFIKISFLTLVTLASYSCQSNNKKNTPDTVVSKQVKTPKEEKLSEQDLSNYETAYFASGCFWCVEAIFESVKGVKEVVSGYAGGKQENPTYEQISYGKSDHAEAVEVYYNPEEISFTALVQVFFGSHDPTSLNRQGPDRGTQYRSIAFYKNDAEKKVIDNYIKLLKDSGVYGKDPIVTEVASFEKFWIAEAYHQDYEKKNPNNSYIRNVSVPRYNRFKENFGDYLKPNAH